MTSLPNNYTPLQSTPIEEIACHLTLVQHQPTGAHILHLGNDDPENVFVIALRTLPSSSDGAPHILEHTVLCGSDRYPVKDPFFSMIRRSLNTFMNAMTGDDVTFYPAASQIEQDFYNLLSVYLDAVFHPKLDRFSFLQEGHRLAFDEEGHLTYQGIVYNEMKGALTQVDARWWHQLMEALYPQTPYRFNSGGDPKIIPQLTYEELKAFHAQYYQPSRALFYFYGDIPLEQHLFFLEKEVFDRASPLPPLDPIPIQPSFPKPLVIEASYPIALSEPGESLENKTLAIFGWVTTSPLEPLETLLLTLLDQMITGTDAAPLKSALLASGLCQEVYSAVDSDMAQIPFIICCKGCSDNLDPIEKIIRKTLEELSKADRANTGALDSLIEGAIHQLELSRTEITGNSIPYGLSLFQRTAPLLQLGGDPALGLRIHTLFDQLRNRLAQPGTLAELIDRYLLNNPHFCRLTMRPDPEQTKKELTEEQEHLQQREKKLTEKERKAIAEQAKALEAFQQAKEDLSSLPRLHLKDIPPKSRCYPLHVARHDATEVYHHDCFTNQMVYASLIFDLPPIQEEELIPCKLLTFFLTEIGCDGRDYRQTLEAMQRTTGGVEASLSLYPQVENIASFRPAFALSGRTLGRHADSLFHFIKSFLFTADWTDRNRLRELIIQLASSLQNELPQRALGYATTLSAAPLSQAAFLTHAMKGLPFYHYILDLAHHLDERIDPLIEHLQSLYTRLVAKGKADLVITTDQKTYQAIEATGFGGLTALASPLAAPWDPLEIVPALENSHKTHTVQGKLIASSVGFHCTSFPSIPYPDPATPLLALSARIAEHQTLHPQIREQGGAYGSGAQNHPHQGYFTLYSYRDPNLLTTLQAFRQALQQVAQGNFSAEALEQAKFTSIQRLDTPIAPGSRGHVAYRWLREGTSDELRQKQRDRLIKATIDDVTQAAHRYLSTQLDQAITVSFSGEALFKQEALRLEQEGWSLTTSSVSC